MKQTKPDDAATFWLEDLSEDNLQHVLAEAELTGESVEDALNRILLEVFRSWQ